MLSLAPAKNTAVSEPRMISSIKSRSISREFRGTSACCTRRVSSERSHVIVYGMSKSEAALPSLWLMQNSITLRFFLIYEITQEQREAALGELTGLLREATLKHSIGLRLPLREAASAHDRIEQGSVMGNVVLDIP
jgi:NADPH:quinone reductase-like Zn-dependent oxidoreductase